MTGDRRAYERIPVGFYVNQIIDDRPYRCFTTDLSAAGLFAEKLVEPLQRRSNVVQLEIPLPDERESLWAKGSVVYDRVDALFHGSAIHLSAMAEHDRRRLREWLHDTQRAQHPLPPHPFRKQAVTVLRRVA